MPPELADLVAAIEEARTQRGAVRVVGELLLDGAALDDVWRATLIAACRQLTQHQLAFVAHPLWMVPPLREMAARGGTTEDGVLAVLHMVDFLKSEQRDSRGERVQPGTLSDSLPDPLEAAALLVQAVRAGDADDADAAAVSLFRAGDGDGLAAALAAASCSNLANLGHSAVHASQMLRASVDLGWDFAETPIRCLAFGLAQDVAGDEADLGPLAHAEELAPSLPENWADGPPDVGSSWGLLPLLRTSDPTQAQEVVAQALTDGIGADAAFDAIALRASELSLMHVGLEGFIPALHTSTGLEGYRHLFSRLPDDMARRVLVLQVAALVAVNAAEATGRSDGKESDVEIDALVGDEVATAAEILETAAEDPLAAAEQGIGFVAAHGIGDVVLAELTHALRAADEEHQVKLPVANWLLAEAAQVELRGHVLAGSRVWTKHTGDADWKFLDEAKEIAAELG